MTFYQSFFTQDEYDRLTPHVWVLLNKKRKVLGVYASHESLKKAARLSEIQVKPAEEQGLPKSQVEELKIHGVVKAELSWRSLRKQVGPVLPPETLFELKSGLLNHYPSNDAIQKLFNTTSLYAHKPT